MGGFLIAILIVTLTPAFIFFFNPPKRFQFQDLIDRSRPLELVGRLKLADFISHVKLAKLISFCCGKRKLTMLPLRKQGSRAKKLDSRFRGNDKYPFPQQVLINRFKSFIFHKTKHNQTAERLIQPDLNTLNCRVQLMKQKEQNSVYDIFNVQIAGSIHAPSDTPEAETTLQISITDVTDGIVKSKPVQTKIKQWSAPGGTVFCYNADLGRLLKRTTTLSDWTEVAQLKLDWLKFAHKGKRNLQFSTSILSQQSGQELACAKCDFAYDNPELGYIDLQENIQRTKTLAVALAFVVSAADRRLYDREIELIKNWTRENFNAACASDKARCKLEQALNKTVDFFRNGNQLNIYEICKEMVEIAPIADCYDVLELCLRVARANGRVAAEEMAILKNLASWLEVDTNRFRAMMEKTLPVNMHQVKDAEVIFGVTSDMSKEKTRQQLNKEYGKWNSRVTSSDPKIRAQADQMLELIAITRSQYVG